MQTIESLQHILLDCRMMYLTIELVPRVVPKGDGFLIQLSAFLPDNNNPYVTALQSGAKYYISSYAIDDEVVGQLWKAHQDFILHEARELFQYRGQCIFKPHFPVNALHELASTTEDIKRPQTLNLPHE